MFSIRVFCKEESNDLLERLRVFIDEGGYFENDSIFLSSEKNSLQINYDSKKVPIKIITHSATSAYFQKHVNGLLFVLDKSIESKKQTFVKEFLSNVKLTVEIQFEPKELNDDNWEMLDSIESYLAKMYDGLVHTDDEFFFDKNLIKIYKL